MHWGQWEHMSEMHSGWMWLGWILGFVAIGVVLFIIASWVSSRATRNQHDGTESKAEAGESPEEILKSRYARGEIQRDQYVHMLEDLRH